MCHGCDEIGWQGREGQGSKFPEPDYDPRTPKINQLAEMKTSEDMWLNRKWLLCAFLTLIAIATTCEVK